MPRKEYKYGRVTLVRKRQPNKEFCNGCFFFVKGGHCKLPANRADNYPCMETGPHRTLINYIYVRIKKRIK